MRSLERKGNVFLFGKQIGEIEQNKEGFTFRYLGDYQGIAISLSLPVEKREFYSKELFPYFVSLVPEGWLKDRYSKIQQIDERDLFGLLLGNGENMLGAVQIYEVKK